GERVDAPLHGSVRLVEVEVVTGVDLALLRCVAALSVAVCAQSPGEPSGVGAGDRLLEVDGLAAVAWLVGAGNRLGVVEPIDVLFFHGCQLSFGSGWLRPRRRTAASSALTFGGYSTSC